jgi:hypothetical protein
MLMSPDEMSVELMQQLYGTPQRSTDGDEQLKYSFLDLKYEIYVKNLIKSFNKNRKFKLFFKNI